MSEIEVAAFIEGHDPNTGMLQYAPIDFQGRVHWYSLVNAVRVESRQYLVMALVMPSAFRFFDADSTLVITPRQRAEE